MTSQSYEIFQERQKVKGEVLKALNSHRTQAFSWAQSLQSKMSGTTYNNFPILAASWGNFELVEALLALGATPPPILKGENEGLFPLELIQYQSMKGMGLPELIAGAPISTEDKRRALAQSQRYLHLWPREPGSDHPLWKAFAMAIRSENHKKPGDRNEQTLRLFQNDLMEEGASLSGGKAAHEIGVAISGRYSSDTWTSRNIPVPQVVEDMVTQLRSAVSWGVNSEECVACVHATILRGQYKRYKSTSDLPQGNKLLIEAGFPLKSSKASEQYNPLAVAVNFGHVQAARRMVYDGADQHWKDPRLGTTYLMLAASGKQSTLEAISVWPEGSWKDIVNYQNTDGNTALHLAVKAMSSNVVEWLFNEGADPAITNNKKITALKYLGKNRGAKAQENFEGIVDLFKDQGIPLNKKENNPFPPACRLSILVSRFCSQAPGR